MRADTIHWLVRVRTDTTIGADDVGEARDGVL
jgi:hypothetical protein